MVGPADRGRIPLRFVQVPLFLRKNLSTIYRKTPSIYRILSKFSDIIFAFFEFCASPGQLPYSCGRRHGFDFQNLHRNKKNFTLNLKTEKGKEIFFELAKNADVIVENYRPRVKERLGIDYEEVRRIHPLIVYGSISGFGQRGPYAERPGLGT